MRKPPNPVRFNAKRYHRWENYNRKNKIRTRGRMKGSDEILLETFPKEFFDETLVGNIFLNFKQDICLKF